MEPSDRVFVPARVSASGFRVIRVCRRPDGARTGVAFTTADRLERVAGACTPYVVLSLAVLRGMLAEVEVLGVELDPELMVLPDHFMRVVS